MAENPIKAACGKNVFTCDVCFKQFNFKTNLKRHSRVHTGEKPYFCKVCFESFSHFSTMKSHLLSHSAERKFVCRICNKSYIHDRTLKDHMRTHVETDLLCQYCSKKLADRAALKRHIRMHVPDESLTCKLCNKSFTRSINLQMHYDKFRCKFRQSVVKTPAIRLAPKPLPVFDENSVAFLNMTNVQLHSSENNFQAIGESKVMLVVSDQVTATATDVTENISAANSLTDHIQSPVMGSVPHENVQTIFVPDILPSFIDYSEKNDIFSSTALNLSETGSTDASINASILPNSSNDENVQTNFSEESFPYFDESNEVIIEIPSETAFLNDPLSSFPEPDEQVICENSPEMLDSENLNPIISESDTLQSILDNSNSNNMKDGNADSLQMEDVIQENLFSDSISDKMFFIPSTELPRTEVELLIGSEALIDESLQFAC